MQTLALTLRSGAFTFVRTRLPVVRRPLTHVSNSVALIGDALSFVSDPLAPGEFSHATREGVLALTQLKGATVGFAWHAGAARCDHHSTLTRLPARGLEKTARLQEEVARIEDDTIAQPHAGRTEAQRSPRKLAALHRSITAHFPFAESSQ
ncbi:hypothetical protein PP713_00930 [Mycobacterium sp. CSUR Q5927]|nr:hypothetical protein [Mycobacterium sp. CSUR Q5927]